VPNAFFFDEQLFLPQAKQTSESNAAQKPDLDLVAQGEVHLARQGRRGELAPGQPTGMAILRWTAFKIEFALSMHAGILASGEAE